MIYEHFRVTGAHEAVLDYSELFSFTLDGECIEDFDTRWDFVLLSTSEAPNDKILESLNKMRIRGSAQLTTVLSMYEEEINEHLSKPSYQRMKTMVKRHRSKRSGHENLRPETGVLVKTRKGKNVSV